MNKNGMVGGVGVVAVALAAFSLLGSAGFYAFHPKPYASVLDQDNSPWVHHGYGDIRWWLGTQVLLAVLTGCSGAGLILGKVGARALLEACVWCEALFFVFFAKAFWTETQAEFNLPPIFVAAQVLAAIFWIIVVIAAASFLRSKRFRVAVEEGRRD